MPGTEYTAVGKRDIFFYSLAISVASYIICAASFR